MLAGEMGELRPLSGVWSFPCQFLVGHRAQGGAPRAPNSPGGAGPAQPHTCSLSPADVASRGKLRHEASPHLTLALARCPGGWPAVVARWHLRDALQAEGTRDTVQSSRHQQQGNLNPSLAPLHGQLEPFTAPGSGVCSFPASGAWPHGSIPPGWHRCPCQGISCHAWLPCATSRGHGHIKRAAR